MEHSAIAEGHSDNLYKLALCQYYTKPHIGTLLVKLMGVGAPRRLVDLGSGDGSLSKAAGGQWRGIELLTIDVDERCGNHLSKGLAGLGVRSHIHMTLDALEVDLPDVVLNGSSRFDAALCNPPYRQPEWRPGFEKILDAANLTEVYTSPAEVPAEVVFLAQTIRLTRDAGRILFEQSQVSHGGPDRTYRRLIPHFSSLVAVRAFSGKSRGGQARQIVEFLNRPLTKHPVRRKIDSVLDADSLSALRLDLPACQACSTPRLSENQKFCHACGSKLVDDSTFTRCMELSFDQVPHLTRWARQRLKDHDIRKIGDLMTLQDPGTELRKIYMVGAVRAERIVTAVESYVDEFLS